MKRYILFILLISLFSGVYAQNQFGLLPQINTNFKVNDSWKMNTKLEGRQLFLQNPFPDGKPEVEFERLDLELVATKRMGPMLSLGGGYLLRRESGEFIHRFIQQLSITQKFSTSRIAHRIRTDQTLEKEEAVQLRLRYRLSWEKALNGLEIDPEEFYLKINNEYLGILQQGEGNLEVRGLAAIAYVISDKNQIETGVDYRLEDLVGPIPVHKLFLTIGYYHSF